MLGVAGPLKRMASAGCLPQRTNMFADDDEMPSLFRIPEKSIVDVLQPIKKDTTGWAEAFAHVGIGDLEDLFELTEVELRDVFKAKDVVWDPGVVFSLRKRVKELVIRLSGCTFDLFRSPR